MARRRYISTKLSLDAKVNKLAMTAGDFAALLYTWMIPHAEDDARLTGDPDEILMMVCPGRRDKSTEDIAAALQAMHDLRLVEWNQDEGYVQFPASFYGYQSYITEKRKGAQNVETPKPVANNSAKQRKTAQNAASSSVSISSSSPKGERTQTTETWQIDHPPAPMCLEANTTPPEDISTLVDQVQQAANLYGKAMVALVEEYAPKLAALGKDITTQAAVWRESFPGGSVKSFSNWLRIEARQEPSARASPLGQSPPKKFKVFDEVA